MAHRVGICSSCRTRYQIPATFAHDRARCRSCGGVVEIGPLEGEAAAKAAVAAAPTPAPTPPVAPVVEAETPRAPAPAPASAPAAEAATFGSAPVGSAPVGSATVGSATRRSALVPVLVGGLILAALAFGAWQLFG